MRGRVWERPQREGAAAGMRRRVSTLAMPSFVFHLHHAHSFLPTPGTSTLERTLVDTISQASEGGVGVRVLLRTSRERTHGR
jgi:hypothetical protein